MHLERRMAEKKPLDPMTNGRGCDVVYDSIGKDTFDGSLECLAPRGMLVTFGQSSGIVPPFDLLRLSKTAGFVT